MKVSGRHYFTIWLKEGDDKTICIIDQLQLPHRFIIEELHSVDGVVKAIRDMQVRGAGLIGAAAGYGMYLAVMEAAENSSFEERLFQLADLLKTSRPTAVNLEWAVNRQLAAIANVHSVDEKIETARETALQIAREDAACCRQIGIHGAGLLSKISKTKERGVLNILTHCNAGWLAFVDHGTALAPVYEAFDHGMKVHVWIDETRPRNQGAGLTAWELNSHGIPHTVIVDNAGGHLMQHGMVDLVITGADRVTRTGDIANKIGTYLKALAAYDNDVPFYVALPSSTFDWNIRDGIKDIPIEERSQEEVIYMDGWCDNKMKRILVASPGSPALNYGFDVTPARLISGLITERGICGANEEEILRLFPEKNERA